MAAQFIVSGEVFQAHLEVDGSGNLGLFVKNLSSGAEGKVFGIASADKRGKLNTGEQLGLDQDGLGRLNVDAV